MIERLDNNENILLMYLSGELPAADRRDVEQMLSADSSLRSELQRLQSAQQMIEQGLQSWDQSDPLPGGNDFAARAVAREIRQRLARTRVAVEAPAAERRRRSWNWAYPAAAAAAIAVASAVWITHRPSPRANEVVAVNPQDERLLIRTFTSDIPNSEDDREQVAMSNDTTSDAMPQDELSQVMLNEE